MIDDPVPAEVQVDLWWYPVSTTRLSWADIGVLDEAETARAAAYLRCEDRTRYEISHVKLRQVLARYVDTPAAELRFTQQPCPSCGRADRGRPMLAGGGPHFSLSHSGDLVAIAVARTPVGLDVERDQTHCMCDMTRYMHDEDRAKVLPLPEPARHEAVLRWWVRTEAIGKCRGDGIGHGLGTCPVLGSPVDDASPLVSACRTGRYAVLPLPVPTGFQGAVAVSAPAADTRIVLQRRSRDDGAEPGDPEPSERAADEPM